MLPTSAGTPDLAGNGGRRGGVSYAALGLGVAVATLFVASRRWLFPPSVSVDERNAFKRLNRSRAHGGTEALSTFYGWRQDAWVTLARGTAGVAAAVLLAFVGATLEDGKTEQTMTTRASGLPGTPTKTTTTSTRSSTEVFALVGGLSAFAIAFWFRARAVQREFKSDIVRL